MLKDILTDIAIETGRTSTDEDKNARIYRLNKAAEEVHSHYDLEEGKDEKVFIFAQDNSPQIALPPFVFQTRGMRFHNSKRAIDLDSMINRYNFQWANENELWYLKFRKKKEQCLSRNIVNQSILKISIPLAETASFTITVTGETDNSYRISETITFSPGDLEKQTVLNFKHVEAITKNIITKYNIIIKDVEDNVLGHILNSEYQSSYKIFQIGDSESFTIPSEVSAIEVWFKYKLQPFKNDEDCFLGTSRYDKALFWKYMEHRSKKTEDAAGFNTKCADAIEAAKADTEHNERIQMNFKPQALFEVYNYGNPW